MRHCANLAHHQISQQELTKINFSFMIHSNFQILMPNPKIFENNNGDSFNSFHAGLELQIKVLNSCCNVTLVWLDTNLMKNEHYLTCHFAELASIFRLKLGYFGTPELNQTTDSQSIFGQKAKNRRSKLLSLLLLSKGHNINFC